MAGFRLARPPLDQEAFEKAATRVESMSGALFLSSVYASSVGKATEQSLHAEDGEGHTIDEAHVRWCGLYECSKMASLEWRSKAHLATLQQALDAIVNPKFKLITSSISEYPDSKDRPQDGYTYTSLLGSSAVVIHTYPESRAVTVNAEVCADKHELDAFMSELKDFFGAASVVTRFDGSMPIKPKQ